SLLQMAEKTTRGPQDVPGSSPDENEFPFGYPTNICEDVPDQKYLCSNCNNILKKALQTLCGHRNNKNAICQKCKEEDPSTLSEGSLLAEERNPSTPLINKDGCRFSEVGCSFRGSKEKIKDHEKTAIGAHMLLLLQHIKQLKASLCTAASTANGFISQSELNVNGAGKSISDLQIPVGLEINGDLEVDCFPGSSVSEDESVLQQLMREKVISELENKLHVFENIVAVLNKEVETSNLEITAFRRQNELDQNIIRGLELKIAELHRCLTQKDAGLSSLHKSLLFSEQASYDGVFLWKITDVGRKLQDSVTGRTVSLYSPAFYTAKYGYKVCLRVYLNGDGTGKGTHMSLFFVVMKGDYDALLPWPFRHKVTFMLLDQNNREHIIDAFRPDLTSASFQRPVNDMNVASGCPMFLPLSKLQSPKYAYVKEDTLFLKCIIETN
ncbi:PREDICTED: TNF receptor-associated factor 1, partial [Cariama cristata]|uniref:TNF receptor-associated factor 1 n=1 Tax=Cariama cristata TaxID=54380 RepID=UPI00052034F3